MKNVRSVGPPRRFFASCGSRGRPSRSPIAPRSARSRRPSRRTTPPRTRKTLMGRTCPARPERAPPRLGGLAEITAAVRSGEPSREQASRVHDGLRSSCTWAGREAVNHRTASLQRKGVGARGRGFWLAGVGCMERQRQRQRRMLGLPPEHHRLKS